MGTITLATGVTYTEEKLPLFLVTQQKMVEPGVYDHYHVVVSAPNAETAWFLVAAALPDQGRITFIQSVMEMMEKLREAESEESK